MDERRTLAAALAEPAAEQGSRVITSRRTDTKNLQRLVGAQRLADAAAAREVSLRHFFEVDFCIGPKPNEQHQVRAALGHFAECVLGRPPEAVGQAAAAFKLGRPRALTGKKRAPSNN